VHLNDIHFHLEYRLRINGAITLLQSDTKKREIFKNPTKIEEIKKKIY